MKKYSKFLLAGLFVFMPFCLKAEETQEPEVVTPESGEVTPQPGTETPEPEVIRVTSIDFDLGNNQEYEVGDTEQLKPTITPTNYTEKLTWSSSNENVATVNEEGLLTIVGRGQATIKLESENGVFTERELTAYEKMTGIEIEGKNIVGNKAEVSVYGYPVFTAKILPEGAKQVDLKWKATPDDEINFNTWYYNENFELTDLEENQRSIKTYKEGTWKITVSTPDNKFSTSFDLTSTFKVNEIYVEVPEVSLNDEYDGAVIYLSESNKLQIKYSIYPEEAKNHNVKFSMEDESIATIDSKGLITAKKVGTTNIILKSEDGNAVSKYKIEVREKPSSITKAPKVYSGNDENNSIYLAWEPVEGATKYNIYRSTSKKGKYKKIKTVYGYFYVNTKLTYGKTYYYKVEAANNDGKKITKPIGIKVIPSYVYPWYDSNRVTSKKVTIKWDKVDASGYEIYRSTNAKKDFKKIKTITKGKTTSFTDSKLKSNKTYYYKVRAYKTVKGKKIYGKFTSSPEQVKTAPSAPTLNVANNDYDSLKVNLKKKVSGAVRYELYVSTSKKGKYKYYGDLTDTKPLVINGLTLGKTYYYKLRACNKDNKCGDYSSVVSKKVSLNKPSLKTKVQKRNVTLTLSTVNAADGYEIVQSTKKNGKYKKVKLTNGELTSTVKLKKGKYYFKARAYKLVNGKKVYSGYTSIKTVKVK